MKRPYDEDAVRVRTQEEEELRMFLRRIPRQFYCVEIEVGFRPEYIVKPRKMVDQAVWKMENILGGFSVHGGALRRLIRMKIGSSLGHNVEDWVLVSGLRIEVGMSSCRCQTGRLVLGLDIFRLKQKRVMLNSKKT